MKGLRLPWKKDVKYLRVIMEDKLSFKKKLEDEPLLQGRNFIPF